MLFTKKGRAVFPLEISANSPTTILDYSPSFVSITGGSEGQKTNPDSSPTRDAGAWLHGAKAGQSFPETPESGTPSPPPLLHLAAPDFLNLRTTVWHTLSNPRTSAQLVRKPRAEPHSGPTHTEPTILHAGQLCSNQQLLSPGPDLRRHS